MKEKIINKKKLLQGMLIVSANFNESKIMLKKS